MTHKFLNAKIAVSLMGVIVAAHATAGEKLYLQSGDPRQVGVSVEWTLR